MPNEEMWDQFFDPASILGRLGLTPETSSAVDLGCGYGTAGRGWSSPVAAAESAAELAPRLRALG
jgi:hypothetical protein